MTNGSYLKRFIAFLGIAIASNLVLFEMFGDSSVMIRKEAQFIRFIFHTEAAIISRVAAYIHTKAPWLEEVPYAAPDTDTRLSTWYLPPHQVVAEWMFFIFVFIGTIAYGRPVARTEPIHLSRSKRLGLFLTFQTCLWTLVAVVYYKFRSWVQLGEWFAPLYFFQPCHVLLTAYVVLCLIIIYSRGESSTANAVTLFHVLFDLQWFTWVAIVLPDMQALIERDFFGEYFLFYFEHVLLVVLPYTMLCFGLASATHDTWEGRMFRAWYSLAWFGLHHIQVMTPVSLISGIQINYQTHLPEYAMDWFGRAYKPVITGLSLAGILVFAFAIDPLAKRIYHFFRSRRVKGE